MEIVISFVIDIIKPNNRSLIKLVTPIDAYKIGLLITSSGDGHRVPLLIGAKKWIGPQ